ncbi:ATP-binding protein [Bacillus sinesaloumensis]|uniref:ATP-binding protein n=1 Tax=Litchfieldia sinesaloumensis TaxID=1926280 RepID=UPI0009888041
MGWQNSAKILAQLCTFFLQNTLIITSNLEFSQWNRISIDSRLTAALVDRLIDAHVLTFNGGSYRLSNALSGAR